MPCWSRPLKGWLAGCGAATAVICAPIFLVIAGASYSMNSAEIGMALALSTLTVFVITSAMSGIPAAVTIWFTERFRIRSILFFGCLGVTTSALSLGVLSRGQASIDAISWLFLIAGLLAGLTYWSVAGRYAGCDRGSRVRGDPVKE